MRKIDMEGLGHFAHSHGKETLVIAWKAHLTEEIQTEAMQAALEKAVLRHPNFRSVLVSDGRGLAYELSDEKPVLLKEDGRYELGSKALAHFPYRVSCVGKELKLFCHHGLTDGFGSEEFFKTLLYYYMKESGKPVEAEGKIRLCELPCDKAAEDEDSYEKYYDPEIFPKQPEVGKVPLFALPVSYWDMEGDFKYKLFKLSLSKTEVLDFAHKIGASLTAVVAAILDKAFEEAYPLAGKRLISSITTNFRNIFPSLTLHNFSGWTLSFFTPEMQGLPLAHLAAAKKGLIQMQNTERNAHEVISVRNMAGKKYQEMPVEELFKESDEGAIERQAVRSSLGYLLTNVGEVKLPESMKSWIEDMEFYIPAITSPIVCGVNSVGERLTLCISQSFEDDAIVRGILKVCADNGLTASMQDEGIKVYDTLGLDAVKRI